MCGIAGIVALDGKATPPREALEAMLAAVAARGPDDHGVHAEAGVAFGHRRLSILDLSQAGHQPMRHPAGHLLCYNGEIYNHREIRAELPANTPFKSTGDSETLLYALAAWGEAALPKLNGMFGLGWWNRRERTLMLVRDRMGIKPVYYATAGNFFLFCSELKGILASGLVDYEPDPQGVADFLGLRYVPAPLTAVKGIYKLPAGHVLTLRKGEIETHAWWRLPVASMGDVAPRDVQAQFEALLSDAVGKRLLSDVPVGIFLSGGLDSSAVAALVAQRQSTAMKSFSVAFESGGYYDERYYAQQVAKRLKTEHTEVIVTEKQFREHLPFVLRLLDEPVMDLAALPLYFLAQKTREQVKVVLSGEGSDEVLGGYNFNRIAFKLAALEHFQRIPRGLRDFVRSISRGAPRQLITEWSWPSDRYPAMKTMHITRIFADHEVRQLLGVDGRQLAPSRRHVDAGYAKVGHADPINQILSVYAGSWLAEDLLMKADKMTMAHGLELRVPFLDYRLVEFLFSLPGETKVSGPATTGTKQMLRKAMRGKLPRAVLTRDKRGFPVPLAEWVRTQPRWFEEQLGDTRGVGGMFERKPLADLMRRVRAGENLWQQVWNLTTLWIWDREMRAIAREARPLKEAA